ncbi:hypothetical protein BB560_000822 [Smittium megazygosporum]|uniref:Interferon-related developmental regulator N-terminal domain-containing protein n=1 Tax=Smittium megazygosporum TaxID=133381 RepID=A0A2T9ZJ76_9FUNG|nr:hypothetical protein BB560_006082 [Smittium megazygosporum]PVV04666.1 hypothetical protein BB560_000822 [Smittium megazygosporum]
MNIEGTELLRIALSNYSSSGSTAKLEDSEVSAADKIKERIKKTNDSRERGRSPNNSAKNTRFSTPAGSRNSSRETNRTLPRSQSSVKIDSSRYNGSERSLNDDPYNISDDEANGLSKNVDSLSIDQEHRPEKKKNQYPDQLGQFSEAQLKDALNTLLDKITEKRATKREEGLQGICSIMAHKYIADFEENNKESYLEGFRRCLKIYKSTKEALLSVRGIALWFLQFGEGEDTIYQEVYDYLYKISLETDSAPLKAQIIHTLAFATFISSNDYVDAVKIIEMCSKLLRNYKSEELTLISTSSYGLMMNIVAESNIDLAMELFEKDYPSHLNMLESQNVNVRIASAENIALMYELITGHQEDFEFDNQFELLEILEQMSKDSTKKHSKKDKSAQKSALRQVVNYLAENISPQSRISVKNQYITFNTWSDHFKLEAFKFTVVNGIHMHFIENPIMDLIFKTNIGSSDLNNDYGDNERVVVDTKSELAKYRSINKNMMRKARSKQVHQYSGNGSDSDNGYGGKYYYDS